VISFSLSLSLSCSLLYLEKQKTFDQCTSVQHCRHVQSKCHLLLQGALCHAVPAGLAVHAGLAVPRGKAAGIQGVQELAVTAAGLDRRAAGHDRQAAGHDRTCVRFENFLYSGILPGCIEPIISFL